MKSHPFRWVLVGLGIGVAIGVAVKVIQEELTALAEEETPPAQSQPESCGLQPAA